MPILLYRMAEFVVIGWLKNAFAVDPPGPVVPTDAERQVIDRLVREVVRRGMTAPALMFLECSHPFNFVASQVLVFFAPIATVLFDRQAYNTFSKFLERRGSIEVLCRRLEDISAEQKLNRSAGRRDDAGATK
ncbi:MAG: hypothetical protein JXO22_16995 [Phycisphaerae bacterium]|nr:hypothetical protein [Phycisphaerae bacterium]